jgi:hypothetical protein
MTTPKNVVIFLYNRLFDPLIQGNFWLYVKDYLDHPDPSIRFHVVTFEDRRYPLTESQSLLVKGWEQQGLVWTPLQWHPGTGMRNKLMDVWAGFLAVLRLRTSGYRHVVTLGSVAGSYAYLYARLLGMRLFLYQFEPHSEYAIDNGMWSDKSLMYRIAHSLERRAAQFASVIASGTRFMQQRLENEWRVKGRFFKIATVANDRKFKFDPNDRDAMRTTLGLRDDQWVLFYPGKFGSLYYTDETAWMYRWLRELEPRLHFLIVTPHADDEIRGIFDRAGVDRASYTICHSDYADIHAYFFAADFAIIAVPPGPSKRFISNIKVGEYLCAGLPFLITRGVSEDYLVAEEQDVGVVVDDFCETDVKAAWPAIKRYLEMDPEVRRDHCREVGLAYRGFDGLNQEFKAAIDSLIGVKQA